MNRNIFGNFLSKEDGKQYTQYLAVVSATVTLFTAGIYQGWGSPSLVKILSDEYPIPVSAEEASYITIIGPVGHIIGGFLASYLSDSIGRKNTILAIGLPQVLSFCLIFLSYCSKILLYIARVLGGMGEGANIALVPCYIAEVAESNVRGTLGVFVTVTIVSGVLFINIIGSFLTIHEAALICLIFPVVFWITFVNMPESPYYYLMKKDTERARGALQMLRRKQNVHKEIIQLTHDVNRQMSEKGTFKDLFTIPSNKKAFLIVTATRFFQIFTGVIAFASYSQIMISQASDFSPVLGSCILLMGNLTAILLSSWYIDKIGRRPMFVTSSGLTCLTLFAQGIFLTIRDYTTINVSSMLWITMLIIFVYNVAVFGGLGPGVNVFVGEIYSTSIKAKGLSIGSLVFALSVIGSTKIYQYTADNIGIAVPFYIFGTVTFVGTFFFFFLLPETKGRSLETIQQELKGNKKVNASAAENN